MKTQVLFTVTICVLLVMGVAPVALPASAQGAYSAAIIVADDFSGTPLDALDAGQFGADENCTVSLEGQAYAVRGVAADPIDVPHGELVLAQINELLDDAGAAGAIAVVPVDIQGLTTDIAATRISDALDDHAADFYVVNMSFVIVPCEYITALADLEAQLAEARNEKNPGKYNSLFHRSVVFYDDTVFPVMSQRAQNMTDLDPLQTLFADRRDTVIPVAAAGNFGLDFPFWPGAWGQVISVSASEGAGYHAPASWDKKKDTPLLGAQGPNPGKSTHISNYGEVMLPGEYASDQGTLSGTSFAAPRLSVVLALYVSEVGGAICRQPDGDPALAFGDWDNLTLDEAVAEHCPTMAAYLP